MPVELLPNRHGRISAVDRSWATTNEVRTRVLFPTLPTTKPGANRQEPVFRYRMPGNRRFEAGVVVLGPGFLLLATVITQVLLVVVAYSAYRLAKIIRTRFARQQALIVVLLCLVGLVASLQDLGIHAIRLGLLPLDTGGRLVLAIQVLLVLARLALVVPILAMLRQLTAEFARTEGVADSFVGRLPQGVTAQTAGLTKREIEVVRLIGSGRLSDREIADELIISSATAATHVRNIMRKTGIKRRADLALLVLQPEFDAEQ